MAVEQKAFKRAQTAREVLSADKTAALSAMVVAPLVPEKVGKKAAETILPPTLNARKEDPATLLSRKKKKTGNEADSSEQAGAVAVSGEHLDQTTADHKQALLAENTQTSLQDLLSGQSSGAVQQLQIEQNHAGSINLFGGLEYEMLLELVGGAMVGGASAAIAHAYMNKTDTTPPSSPTVNTVTNDNVINATEAAMGVVLSGTNESGATTTINGHAVTQFNATNWFYMMSPTEIATLGEGQALLTVESTDKAGNKSVTSKSVLIDTIASAASVGTVAGDDVINASERDATVVLSGTNEAGASVSVNGQAATVVGSNWFYTLSPSAINAMGQGAETLTIVSTNAAGNTRSTTKQIIVDTVATVAVDSVAGDNIINTSERDASVVLTGTNETGATVLVDSHAATVTGTTWSYTLSTADIAAIGQGNHVFTIATTDTVGNTASIQQTVQIDTVAGVQPQIQLPAASTYWAVDPQATIHTSLGDIVVELKPTAAPITAANWLSYVNSDFFSNLIFHRVIPNFMVQGGGFTADLTQITPYYPSITLESNNGLSNLRGTIAVARTSVADSATDQFFINTVDNAFLDYSNASNPGYAVFGQVLSGMNVVDAISAVATQTATNGMQNVPVNPITITSVDQTVAGTAYSTGLVNLVGLESGAHWEYALDGSTTWLSSATSTLNLSGVDGSHTLAVRQIDAAGNASATSSIDFLLDHTSPVFSSSSTVAAVANHAGAGQVVYAAAASDAGVGHVVYGLKAGSDAALTINTTTGAVTLGANSDYAVQQAYEFTVVATDGVGNQAELHLNLAVLPI